MIVHNLIRATIGIRYTVDGWLFRRRPETIAAMEALRGQFKGRPMLVVGNGPSLNQTPLGDFGGVPSIGMNKINLLFPRSTWRPSIIVCVNNLVVKQNREFFAESEIPVFLSWKCRWFMGGKQGTNLHYFLSKPSIDFSHDASSSVAARGATVTYTALQFAYYFQANPIILFGVDHYFNTKESERGIAKSKGPDDNHFDPGYFGKNMYWGLPDLEGSEKAYRIAKSNFEQDDREILDATIGGKLQVFKKISVEDARRLCQITKNSDE